MSNKHHSQGKTNSLILLKDLKVMVPYEFILPPLRGMDDIPRTLKVYKNHEGFIDRQDNITTKLQGGETFFVLEPIKHVIHTWSPAGFGIKPVDEHYDVVKVIVTTREPAVGYLVFRTYGSINTSKFSISAREMKASDDNNKGT